MTVVRRDAGGRERRQRAGFCSRSVTKSWYFDTTTAKRKPAAAVSAGASFGSSLALVGPTPGLPLPALELRLALLEERRGAFAHVVGGRDETEQRRLVARTPSANGISSPLLTASRM